MFSIAERLDIAKELAARHSNVEVMAFRGLLRATSSFRDRACIAAGTSYAGSCARPSRMRPEFGSRSHRDSGMSSAGAARAMRGQPAEILPAGADRGRHRHPARRILVRARPGAAYLVAAAPGNAEQRPQLAAGGPLIDRACLHQQHSLRQNCAGTEPRGGLRSCLTQLWRSRPIAPLSMEPASGRRSAHRRGPAEIRHGYVRGRARPAEMTQGMDDERREQVARRSALMASFSLCTAYRPAAVAPTTRIRRMTIRIVLIA